MASAAGSTTDIEPEDRLRDWFTAYISKFDDIDKKNPIRIKQYSNYNATVAKIPDEMRQFRKYCATPRSKERDTRLTRITGVVFSASLYTG